VSDDDDAPVRASVLPCCCCLLEARFIIFSPPTNVGPIVPALYSAGTGGGGMEMKINKYE